jgi:SNF2 family DNA or RNA helicase
MVIIPHLPYYADFALFPKLKMKLKGRRFETVSDIQRESQAVLDSLRKMTTTALLKRVKNDGIAVYVPKETILREIPDKIE